MQYPVETTIQQHASLLFVLSPSSSLDFHDRLPQINPPDTVKAHAVTTPVPRKHARQRESGYVPRPRNSFIVFRSRWIADHNSSGTAQQNELSKQAANEWKGMSDEQKQPFKDIAAQEQLNHKVRHPHYQYSPSPRAAAAPRTKSASVKPASRKAASATHDDSARLSTAPPEGPPSTYMFRICRAAVQSAISRRLEEIALAPISLLQGPPDACANFPAARESQDVPEFVPIDEIPVLHLEPYFVSDMPPALTQDNDFSSTWMSPYTYASDEQSTLSAPIHDWQLHPYLIFDDLDPEPEMPQPPSLPSDTPAFCDFTLNAWLQSDRSLDSMSIQ